MFTVLLLVFLYLERCTVASSVQTIRGITTQRISLYDPLKDFTCLDGSLTLPFTYVNDNYCDCPDGSDEPGTAACPHGTFHCLNKGYIPKNIPSSFVDDGICDCCDASDEYNNKNCTNTCEELGYEAQREAEKISQMIIEGARIRSQMILSAKDILGGKQKRVAELEVEKAEANRLKDEAEVLKKEAEEKESAALEQYKAKEEAERAQKAEEDELEDSNEAKTYFDSFDTNHDEELSIDELKAQQVFDQNMDGEVSEEELKYIGFDQPLTFDVYKEVVWPRVKPVIVMKKIKEQQGLPLPEQDSQVAESPKEEEGYNEDEEEEEGEGEEEVDEEPEANKDFIEKGRTDPKYDEETAKLVEAANEARDNFEKASRAHQDIERELSNLKNFLSKDYGIEDEFVALDGQCFTYTDREYSYKLCPFDQVTQMAKSGGSETRLGTWAGWADKSYGVMLYDKGQSCWNGPQRSTKVSVGCGLENEVVSAAEPNKCEYVLEFKTPAACRSNEKIRDVHEEL